MLQQLDFIIHTLKAKSISIKMLRRALRGSFHSYLSKLSIELKMIVLMLRNSQLIFKKLELLGISVYKKAIFSYILGSNSMSSDKLGKLTEKIFQIENNLNIEQIDYKLQGLKKLLQQHIGSQSYGNFSQINLKK